MQQLVIAPLTVCMHVCAHICVSVCVWSRRRSDYYSAGGLGVGGGAGGALLFIVGVIGSSGPQLALK